MDRRASRRVGPACTPDSQVAEIAASLCASLYVEFEEQFQLPPLLNEKTPTTREIAGVLYACTSC